MNVEKLLLVFILISLFAVNYSFLDKKITGFLTYNVKEIHVDRIIDGDTIKSGNQSIRLLGINTLFPALLSSISLTKLLRCSSRIFRYVLI